MTSVTELLAAYAAKQAAPSTPALNIPQMDTPCFAEQLVDTVNLNEKQRLAVSAFLTNKHGLLVGYAGTGKTTTSNAIVRQLQGELNILDKDDDVGHLDNLPSEYPAFAICAFTGMAVKQIRNAVPDDAKKHCYTIHKLLDYGPVEEEWPPTDDDIKNGWNPNLPKIRKMMRPRRGEGRKLPFEAVLIDEISMVSVGLFQELVNALRDDCRIYGIGDIAQLPPVFGTSAMPYALRDWPVVELTQVYRQKDGDMVENAHAIRGGEKPIVSDNFKVLSLDVSAEKAQAQFIAHIKKEYKAGRYDPKQDILLTTNNVSPVGQEMLNVLLRTFLNSGNKVQRVKTMRHSKGYAVGDRIVCTKNYPTKGLYNGMLGWITDINVNYKSTAKDTEQVANTTTIDFDSVTESLNLMEKDQEARATVKKLAAMLGEEGANRVVNISDVTDTEQGTAELEASHVLTCVFQDDFGEDHAVVLNTSSQIENIQPAWAVTVHKAQGSGFRNVYILLHNAGSKLLTNELLYTAVTRCTDNVTLMTTNYALKKALCSRVINGITLEEKVQQYITEYGRGDLLTVPRNQLLTTG